MGKIEWTDRSDWNPFRGCTRVSPGCGGPGKHGGCYAETIAARFSGPGQAFEGFAERKGGEARWTGKVALIEDHLTLPIRWKKPARIFVNSMSDLFHESVPDDWIDRVFAVMALAPQHTFQVLTKRSARMRRYMHADQRNRIFERAVDLGGPFSQIAFDWPHKNVWLGVSAEDQSRADERVPDLLATPAAVRFVSAEPLLGPIDFRNIRPVDRYEVDALLGYDFDQGTVGERLTWVICGAESGHNARPMVIAWARSILSQCASTDVAFFMKQLSGPGGRAVKDMELFPDDLRVREMPRISARRRSHRGGARPTAIVGAAEDGAAAGTIGERMTHVNAQVPRDSEIRQWRESVLMKAELEFWKARADEFARELENIFDHARKTGHVEVWCNREKIDLYTKPDESEAA